MEQKYATDCRRERKQKKLGEDEDERERERSGQREVFMSPVSVFVRLPGRAAGFVHFQNFFDAWQKVEENCQTH